MPDRVEVGRRVEVRFDHPGGWTWLAAEVIRILDDDRIEVRFDVPPTGHPSWIASPENYRLPQLPPGVALLHKTRSLGPTVVSFPDIAPLDDWDDDDERDERCIGARCLNPHVMHDRDECLTIEEAEADHATGLIYSAVDHAEKIANHLRAARRAGDLGEWSDAAEFLTRAATLSRARDEDLAEVAEFLEQAGFVR